MLKGFRVRRKIPQPGGGAAPQHKPQDLGEDPPYTPEEGGLHMRIAEGVMYTHG
jgi:hypothetical protein